MSRNIKKTKKYKCEFWTIFYHVKCSLKSIKISYTFRKFKEDICKKKPLEKILILRENIKKSVDWFQIFEYFLAFYSP